jgi:CRP/FNR family transcriptional regulator, cyclic AMP receptor protein
MTVLKTHKIDFKILDRPDVPVRTFAAGDPILRLGEPAREMFLLRKGKVEIRVHGKIVEEVGPGGIFGEMALIDQSARSATAVAAEDCEVVPIDERLFIILIQDAPYFALDVMRVLVTRLRAMNRLM